METVCSQHLYSQCETWLWTVPGEKHTLIIMPNDSNKVQVFETKVNNSTDNNVKAKESLITQSIWRENIPVDSRWRQDVIESFACKTIFPLRMLTARLLLRIARVSMNGGAKYWYLFDYRWRSSRDWFAFALLSLLLFTFVSKLVLY